MNIGPDAIPQLTVAMTNQDEAVRFRALLCLGHIIDTTGNLQTAIRPAIPVLVAQLNDGSPHDRQLAARTLAKIHQDAPLVVPALIEALKRESDFNRKVFDNKSGECFDDSLQYIRAIGSFHTNAQSAVPYLLKTIQSDPSPLAESALETLRLVSPEIAEPYIQKLNAAITNRMPDDLISNLYYNFHGQGEPPIPVDRRLFQ